MKGSHTPKRENLRWAYGSGGDTVISERFRLCMWKGVNFQRDFLKKHYSLFKICLFFLSTQQNFARKLIPLAIAGKESVIIHALNSSPRKDDVT